MLDRVAHRTAVARLLREFPVVAILGARQVGKTTLARDIARHFRGATREFDLESESDLSLFASPESVLEPLRGLVVIDEVQRLPALFPPLRPLVDRRPIRARYLLLGSAAPAVATRGSESLAGRIAFHELGGFNLGEVGANHWQRLWLRGGYPLSYLAKSERASAQWRREFLRTYLERDVLGADYRMPAIELRRFWMMMAHWHGQRWTHTEFARSFGVSEATVRRWLAALAALFAVRILPPWHESIAKRQVKAPKVYIADSGLFHEMLGIDRLDALRLHPRIGASFEGFAIEQLTQAIGARTDECFHWATHQGAELDLLVVRGVRRIGFEIKCSESATLTMSMRIAAEDLRLDQLFVVYQGRDRYRLGPTVEALPIDQLDHIRGVLGNRHGR